MSSIPELLKEAYEKKDWGVVAIVYQNLTGIKLAPNETQASIYNPKQPYKTPQPIYVPQQTQAEYQMPTAPPGKSGKPDRLLPPLDTKKGHINLFADDGKEFSEDKKIDKVLCQANPTTRGTRGSDMVNVVCRQCHRPSTISKALIRKNFICDDCINGQHRQY